MSSFPRLRLAFFLLVIPAFPVLCLTQTTERYLLGDTATAKVSSFNVSDNTPAGVARAGSTVDAIAVSPNGRLAFVANRNDPFISVVDLTIGAEVARIIDEPVRALALTGDGSRLIVPGDFVDRVKIVDTNTLQAIADIDINGLIGDDPALDGDVSVSSAVVVGNRAYLNTHAFGVDWSIAVIDLATMTASALPGSAFGTGSGSSSLAASHDGSRVVAVRQKFGVPSGLMVIDPVANQVLATYNIPFSYAVATDGIHAFLIHAEPGEFGQISTVRLSDGQFLGSATLPFILGNPFTRDGWPEIVLTADNSRAYVVTPWTNVGIQDFDNVAVVDTALLAADPANAVVSHFHTGISLGAITIAPTLSQPPSTAPVVTGVSPSIAVNDQATTVNITGANFAPNARVRIGRQPPVNAVPISPGQLQVVVPAESVAQSGDIVVTNPGTGTVNDQHESGILHDKFAIVSPPAFQPAHQILVTNQGESTISIINTGTDFTLAPALPAPPRPVAIAVTPDGARAYAASFFPGVVQAINLVTRQVEATLPTSGSVTGGIDGMVIRPNPGISAGQHLAYVVSSKFVGPSNDHVLNIIDVDPLSPTFNSVVSTIDPGTTNNANPGALDATPDGRYVYSYSAISNIFNDARVYVFDVLSGTAVTLSTSNLGVGRFQLDVEVTPDGDWLLLRHPSGPLKVLDISNPVAPVGPVASIESPGAFFRKNEVVGNRLYAELLSEQGTRVQIFNFDPGNNNFAPLGQPYELPGLFGAGLAVTPDGSLTYMATFGTDAIAAFDNARLVASDPSALLTWIRGGIGTTAVAFRPGTPTETGSNVEVQPIQEVTLSFTNVTSSGQTTVTTTNTTSVSAPAGFVVGDIPIYYEITSTATFDGPVEVCFNYDESQVNGPESSLRVLHEENGEFVDRTVSLDTANNVICALVDSFSAFVVGLGSVDFIFDSLIDSIADATDHPGIRRSLQAKALAARAARDRGDTEAARNQLQALLQEIQALRGGQLSESAADKLTNDVQGLLGGIA